MVGLTTDGLSRIRDWLLIQSFYTADPRHLRYAPAEAKERDDFLRSRGEVDVIVPWNMTGEEFLNLYGLRNHPEAVREVELQAGGLPGSLEKGQMFSLRLN